MSFADRYLRTAFEGSEQLIYLATRMGVTYERMELWRYPRPRYGWFGMGCPGDLDQRDNANAYSPEGPEDE